MPPPVVEPVPRAAEPPPEFRSELRVPEGHRGVRVAQSYRKRISITTSNELKAAWQQRARRKGFPSLSAYLRHCEEYAHAKGIPHYDKLR